MRTKANYVRSQGQTRKHHCHWPGCEQQVPPAMWGCSYHWFKLPRPLRDQIWATYKPGQELAGTPSAAYVEAAKAVQAWIADNDAKLGSATIHSTQLNLGVAMLQAQIKAGSLEEELRDMQAELRDARIALWLVLKAAGPVNIPRALISKRPSAEAKVTKLQLPDGSVTMQAD